MVYCYLKFKLRYLKNLKLFSIKVKELFEAIVLRGKKKAHGFLLFHMNAKKTQFMAFNQPHDVQIKTQDGSNLKEVKDFKYLGAWMQSTEADIRTRKASAWKACNNLNNIWRSNLTKNIKVNFFQATVESVLLYGSETWTVTNKIGKSLDHVAATLVCWEKHLMSAGKTI